MRFRRRIHEGARIINENANVCENTEMDIEEAGPSSCSTGTSRPLKSSRAKSTLHSPVIDFSDNSSLPEASDTASVEEFPTPRSLKHKFNEENKNENALDKKRI